MYGARKETQNCFEAPSRGGETSQARLGLFAPSNVPAGVPFGRKNIMVYCDICNQQLPNIGKKIISSIKSIRLERHHITPKIHGGNNDPSNLINLCSTCHGALHGLYRFKAEKMAMKNDPNFFINCVVELRDIKNGSVD